MQSQIFFIGIDVGSSFIKLSLINNAQKTIKQVRVPQHQMQIIAHHQGWAQQNPQVWWQCVEQGLSLLVEQHQFGNVKGIGISYQMHGLVMVDQNNNALANSIIWCDSRATQIGNQLYQLFKKQNVINKLLNHPSNFTLSKLMWVKKHQPQIFNKIHKIMLPGDFIAMKFSNKCQTTKQGLSEGVFWDYLQDTLCKEVFTINDIKQSIICQIVQNFTKQAVTSQKFNKKYGLSHSIPIYYRSGDQPNNAFSLNVLNVGQIAATGGTSGVLYAISQQPFSKQILKFNSFLHVNHTAQKQRIGKLLCINGCGSTYHWLKKNLLKQLTYSQINQIAKTNQSCGIFVIPFGNGSERILQNMDLKCHILGIDFNFHNLNNIARATVEGIAFCFVYGAEIMKGNGIKVQKLKAGQGNLFQCQAFCEIICTILNTEIQIYETNGSLGAAKAALLGYLKQNKTQFSQNFQLNLSKIKTYQPNLQKYNELVRIYQIWKSKLEQLLQNKQRD